MNESQGVWFEGEGQIDCSIEQVRDAFEDLGEHYVGVVRLMPGLTSVELVEQGSDYVIIQTNEGLMKRSNITRRIEPDSVVIEFDEEYQAGTRVTATSHFTDEFTAARSGVSHRTVVRGVEAPGLLGFFYRKFGSSKMGGAFLSSYKEYFEQASR